MAVNSISRLRMGLRSFFVLSEYALLLGFCSLVQGKLKRCNFPGVREMSVVDKGRRDDIIG